MCTCLTFCWTRQLCNTTLIGPVAFGGRELCILVLYYAGTESYLALLTSTHNSPPLNPTGPIKVVLKNYLFQQNAIQVHITLVLQMSRDQSK
jgi:hypothetical protein